jgi:hypothetical protein
VRRPGNGVRLLLLGLAAAGLLGALGGVTVAAFSSATANPAGTFEAKAVFPGVRSTSAWSLRDRSSGTESDVSSGLAFDGGGTESSNSAFATAYDTGRYLEFDLNSPLPAGLAVTGGVTFSFRIRAAASGTTACYYPEARTKAGAVLATYAGSERCVTGTSFQTTTVTLPAVDTTDEGNDLVVRVYAKSSPSAVVTYDRATVAGASPYAAFTLYPNSELDRSTGAVSATSTWAIAAEDGAAYTTQAAWSSSFNSGKSVTFAFPAYVPSSATMGTVTLQHRFMSTSGTTCWWFQVLAGASVVESFGNSTTPHECNSPGQWVTSTATLTSVTTPARANTLSIRAYLRNSAGLASQHDFVRLNADYSLPHGAPAGCATPGSATVTTNRDSTVDQNASSNNFGTDAKLMVDSKAPSLNMRAYLGFALPSIPAGCSVTAALLRVYQISATGSRTIQLLRAAGPWAENTITWSNHPGTTGTATTSTTALGWRSWDATAHVQALLSGTDNGFVLRDQTEDAGSEFKQEYASDEDSSLGAPELTVTWG